MGVTHKLKPEVVDFILNQKQENPRVSCRSLVDLLAQQFQVQISKSSINAILKGANLSDPIGRKPNSGQSIKKFQIPPQKKALLFPGASGMPQIESGPPVESTAASAPILPKSLPEKFDPPKTAVTPPRKRKVVPKKELRAIPAPEKRASSADVPASPRSEKLVLTFEPPKEEKAETAELQFSSEKPLSVSDSGVYHDGMGNFFLKAAQWELSSTPMLGDVLLKNQPLVSAEEANIAEVLLYLPSFGMDSAKNLGQYTLSGLWALQGIPRSLSTDLLVRLEARMEEQAFELGFRLTSEKLQWLAEINSIRFTLENRMEFSIDARFNTVWISNVHSDITSANNKVIEITSRDIINNVQSMILKSIPGQESIAHSFLDFLAAFENIPGRQISKIALIDTRQEEFAEFHILPSRRRNFLAGFGAHHREFRNLAENLAGKVKSVFVPELGVHAYFFERKVDLRCREAIGRDIELRAFLLSLSPQESPQVGFMTNVLDGEMKGEQLVSAFLGRWPNVLAGGAKSLLLPGQPATPGFSFSGSHRELSNSDSDPLETPKSASSQVRQLWQDLEAYTRRQFFPSACQGLAPNLMRERFYGMAGYLSKDTFGWRIRLIPPPEPQFRQEAEYAMRKLNESAITDPAGLSLRMAWA